MFNIDPGSGSGYRICIKENPDPGITKIEPQLIHFLLFKNKIKTDEISRSEYHIDIGMPLSKGRLVRGGRTEDRGGVEAGKEGCGSKNNTAAWRLCTLLAFLVLGLALVIFIAFQTFSNKVGAFPSLVIQDLTLRCCL